MSDLDRYLETQRERFEDELCEFLQDALGDWHDAVVQREKLAKLATRAEARESRALSLSLATLMAEIEARKAASIADVLRRLSEQNSNHALLAG